MILNVRHKMLGSRLSQRGAALLLFALIAIVSLSALLLAGLNSKGPESPQAKSLGVLQTAREALIGYALSFADLNANRLPGYMPCPDTDGDGVADVPCGNPGESAIGRLPWQTLGLPPLRDSTGECLWYAVSAAYKENPAAGLSIDADGQFVIYDPNVAVKVGATSLDRAIAVVFAPGRIVQSQVRSVTPNNRTECGSTRTTDGVSRVVNYLEDRSGINNSSATRVGAPPGTPGSQSIPSGIAAAFIASPRFPEQGPADFNDTLAWVSPSELQRVYTRMQVWVGDQVRACLLSYAVANSGIYPWPSVLNGAGSPDYQDDTNERFGRIPSNLSNTASLGFTGIWPGLCFTWTWWNDWREQVFYAVDKSASPSATTGGVVAVDGVVSSIGLILAGRRAASQSRSSNNDKGNIANYLESGNIPGAGAGLIPSGDEDFQTTALTQPSDDYVCTATSCP